MIKTWHLKVRWFVLRSQEFQSRITLTSKSCLRAQLFYSKGQEGPTSVPKMWQWPCHLLVLPPSLKGIANLTTLFTWLFSQWYAEAGACYFFWDHKVSFFSKTERIHPFYPTTFPPLKKKEEKLIEEQSQWKSPSVSILKSRYCPQRLLLSESWPIEISISFV